MFIQQYKLDRNPFAEDSVRPLFVSQSMREVSALVRAVGEAKVQTALVSGAAGVGKTTLLTQRMRGFKNVATSWISPNIDSPQKLLEKLVQEVGPGHVSGSCDELRKILEVYLTHQRNMDRLTVIVVDGVERHRAEVLAELRALLQMRIKQVPILQFVFLTRNDDLVDEILADHEGGGPLARARHARLTGFTLEETQSYIRICLQGAGCEWANELVPDSVVLDIQALTQGVVGDINILCSQALAQLAEQSHDPVKSPRLSSPLVRAVGNKLHMRHAPDNWSRTIDETLSSDAVRIRDVSKLEVEAAHLIVSSGGRQLADIKLDRPRMILGRDAGCDISLDSTYLSRFQNLFMQTENGWLIIDLNSTNGCFVNGRRVREHRLRDGDSISVGHHQLMFAMQGTNAELRHRMPPKPVSPGDDTISADVSDERETWSV
jgi:type II secretory pathway predicted ATPase ExeA